MSSHVVVVGSINMDLVVRADRLPRPGETLLGASFDRHPGGKGANQAVAASRLGAKVGMIGCVGAGEWGRELRGVLASEGVDVQHVQRISDARTGVGLVTVLPDGENAIAVASGANLRLTAANVEAARNEIAGAAAVLLQNEVPPEANRKAIEIAKDAGTMVVLNAAPAVATEADVLGQADLLVVNEEEARTLVQPGEQEIAATGLARRLDAQGPLRVAITLGPTGALLFDGETMHQVDAVEVVAVDATGAGDAFTAGLVLGLLEGKRSSDALRFACTAGGLAVTLEGALPSLPRRKDVDRRVAQAFPRETNRAV